MTHGFQSLEAIQPRCIEWIRDTNLPEFLEPRSNTMLNFGGSLVSSHVSRDEMRKARESIEIRKF